MKYRTFILTRTSDGVNVRESACLFHKRIGFTETFTTAYDAVRAIEQAGERYEFIPFIKGAK
jgi:hypothetical protein